MTDSHKYRLRLANGFLQEAGQDITLERWDLFDEADARQALAMAEEAVSLARQIGKQPS